MASSGQALATAGGTPSLPSFFLQPARRGLPITIYEIALSTVLSNDVIHRLQFEDWVPFHVERVFLFFADPENLPRIMPPATATRIDRVRLVPPPSLPVSLPENFGQLAGAGSEFDTSFRIVPHLPLRTRWVARITEFEWNHHFADIQVKGPFRSWYHRHEMTAETREDHAGTVVRDRIECDLGFGVLGDFGLRILSSQIERTFRYRQRVLSQLLES